MLWIHSLSWGPDVEINKLKFLLGVSRKKVDVISNLFLGTDGLTILSLTTFMRSSLIIPTMIRRIMIDEYDENKPEILAEEVFTFYKGSRFHPQEEDA